MNNGGTKPGNWGDRFVIITPVLYKRVSCATCSHFCQDDYSCLIKPIIPRIDGYDTWKRCEQFSLSLEYMDTNHCDQVRRVKGDNFFNSDKKKDTVVKASPTPKRNVQPPKLKDNSFQSRLCYVFEKYFSCKLQVQNNLGSRWGSKDFTFMNWDKNFMGIALVNGVSKKMRRNWIDKAFHVLTLSVYELQKQPRHLTKVIILPVIEINEDMSLAEYFYKKRGSSLKGIRIIELYEDNTLLIASGPVDQYWTGERIRNVKVFKEE